LEWVAGTDHKSIALRLWGVATFFLVSAGALILLVRTELIEPGSQVVSQDTFNQLFTMHGSTMIFLVATPVAFALGIYFVPLQIGAADIVAPRVALFALWLVACGGVTMFLGFATDHGAGKAGWTAYYPLSGSQKTPGSGMDLWVVGVILAGTAATLLAACVLLTILKLRAPGMSLMRIPVFSWTMLVTSLLAVMSFPALVVAMSLLLADRKLGGGIYDTSAGPVIYQYLFWFYGHPVVYVIFFPFAGVIAEIVAVFSGRRFFGYHAFVIALLAFTALSGSVFAHHMFATGQSTNQFFALTTSLLIIPAGIEYFDMLGTMWRAKIRLTVPMGFALAFMLQFLVGGLTGVFLSAPVLDYHVHDSYFVVGHFHYIAFGSILFGLFAGIHYWFPKVTGYYLRERLGWIQLALFVLGTNLTFFPMLILGYQGMPRRVADYAPEFQTLNDVATAGAFVMGLGVLFFLTNLALSLLRPRPAPADPWQGHTLEWYAASPPPRLNFTSLPPIRSYAPLLDLRERDEVVA
jgi:cytochrome c oxidase subunit 1